MILGTSCGRTFTFVEERFVRLPTHTATFRETSFQRCCPQFLQYISLRYTCPLYTTRQLSGFTANKMASQHSFLSDRSNDVTAVRDWTAQLLAQRRPRHSPAQVAASASSITSGITRTHLRTVNTVIRNIGNRRRQSQKWSPKKVTFIHTVIYACCGWTQPSSGKVYVTWNIKILAN
jgi:hypothetical protein